MKAVDPKTDYTYSPKWAPEVTVHFCQPYGATIPLSGKVGFFDLYLDKFVTAIDGLVILPENIGLPWSRLMPTLLANETFTEISKLGRLDAAEAEG
jgi:hypothetical protein